MNLDRRALKWLCLVSLCTAIGACAQNAEHWKRSKPCIDVAVYERWLFPRYFRVKLYDDGRVDVEGTQGKERRHLKAGENSALCRMLSAIKSPEFVDLSLGPNDYSLQREGLPLLVVSLRGGEVYAFDLWDGATLSLLKDSGFGEGIVGLDEELRRYFSGIYCMDETCTMTAFWILRGD